MSCFTVQVLEPSGKIIEVETCSGSTVSSVLLENRSVPNIELLQCVAQLPPDFRDQIFSVVSGDIVAATGINIYSSGNKLYISSLINAGSGISLSHNSGIYSIAVTGNFGLTSEQVDDRVASLLNAGSNIVLNYDDFSNTLTVSTSGLQPSGNYSLVGHTHDVSNIIDFNSSVSGLLPAIANSGDNRVLTSTGSSVGVNAESNLTFNGSSLVVAGDATVDNLKLDGNILSSTSGNIIISPSGNGALQRDAGGNARGQYAVDWQSVRSTSTMVAGGKQSIIGGGVQNTASNSYSIVGGGFFNTCSGYGAIIAGGANNTNSGYYGTIGGGKSNTSSNNYSTVGGGRFNTSSGYGSTVGGGRYNTSNGNYSTVGGGHYNTSSGSFSTVGGGKYNTSSGSYSTIGGGLQNTSSGNYSAILGGTNNNDQGFACSFILGSGINATQSNTTFVNNLNVDGGTITATSGNFSVLRVNGTGVSISGHAHSSSDITNFNSAVSGLLPVKDIVGGAGVSINSVSGIYTITSTGSGVLSDQARSLVTTVFNETGSPIPKMAAVYINGGQGDLPTVSLAIATSDMTSAGTYGLTYETINNMSSGKVIVFGALTGLNTDQFNPTAPHGNINGTILYLSPTTSGALTTSKPSAPNHIVAIGTVVRTHQNEGVIEVRVQNGFELEELHNVAISGVTNGQFLQYNSASGLWLASSSGNFTTLQVNGTGVSINGHAHTSSDITNFNTAVSGLLPVTDISGGQNITVSKSGTIYTVAVTGSLGLTTEEVDDRVSNLLVAGTGVSLAYNDNSNTLTINTNTNVNNSSNLYLWSTFR